MEPAVRESKYTEKMIVVPLAGAVPKVAVVVFPLTPIVAISEDVGAGCGLELGIPGDT
jgi:H+/gluconate symporter-like permease